jgi:hypothetical protein
VGLEMLYDTCFGEVETKGLECDLKLGEVDFGVIVDVEEFELISLLKSAIMNIILRT